MVGIDIIDVNKIRKLIDKWGEKFINRVFSRAEQDYCEEKKNKFQCYAVRFAAKESFYKAYNHLYGWKALEIITKGTIPYIRVLNESLRDEIKKYKINLSISHIENIGIALVILTVK